MKEKHRLVKCIREHRKDLDIVVARKLKEILKKEGFNVNSENLCRARDIYFNKEASSIVEIVKFKHGYAIKDSLTFVPSLLSLLFTGRRNISFFTYTEDTKDGKHKKGEVIIFDTVDEALKSGPMFLQDNLSWKDAEDLGYYIVIKPEERN